MADAAHRILEISFERLETPEYKIAWFYDRYSMLVSRVQKQHIAEFLAIDKSTYSRYLKKMNLG